MRSSQGSSSAPGGQQRTSSEEFKLNRFCSFFTSFLCAKHRYLNRLGVTHVLNTAENDVHLNPNKLRKEGIAYKGFRRERVPTK